MARDNLTRTLARILSNQPIFNRPIASSRQDYAVPRAKLFSSAVCRARASSINDQRPLFVDPSQVSPLRDHKPQLELKPTATSATTSASAPGIVGSNGTNDSNDPNEPQPIPSGPYFWQRVKRWQHNPPDVFLSWNFQVSRLNSTQACLCALTTG